jgi:archaellum component FlaD/FlaE
MTDPSEYDPDELRRAAFEPGDGERSERAEPGPNGSPDAGSAPFALGGGHGRGTPAGETLADARAGELARLDATVDGLERPYLERLPDALAAERTVFEWLDFLVRGAGLRDAIRALEYYRSIGWLGERAEDRLREYLVGMDAPPGGGGGLDADDHLLSLVYVGRLAAMGHER